MLTPGKTRIFCPPKSIFEENQKENGMTEMDQPTNDEWSEANGPVSGAAQGVVTTTAQGVANLAQGAEKDAQGVGKGLGPENVSEMMGKNTKTMSKQDIHHFLNAAPGTDEYIMPREDLESFTLVQ